MLRGAARPSLDGDRLAERNPHFLSGGEYDLVPLGGDGHGSPYDRPSCGTLRDVVRATQDPSDDSSCNGATTNFDRALLGVAFAFKPDGHGGDRVTPSIGHDQFDEAERELGPSRDASGRI